MKRVEIRPQWVCDAGRFVEILNHPDFIYFPVKPKSIAEERGFLRQNRQKRKAGTEYNFSILCGGKVVGAVGLKVDQHRKHIGEIGYFVDHDHWGQGIAPAAVTQIEEFAFQQLDIRRLEIVTLRPKKASQRVAEKCGYRREGTQRGKLLHNGQYRDASLYAKARESGS